MTAHSRPAALVSVPDLVKCVGSSETTQAGLRGWRRSLAAVAFGLLVAAVPVAAQSVSATVSAGTNPFSVAVNPVTNRIYVANYNSNNVTVVDGATNTTTTVSAGTQPLSVAVNPVTNKIYVANANSANVTVIDGATNGTTTVSVGSNPYSVAVNPVTNKIYVSNQGSNTVTVIDGATNGTTTVSVGANPYSVAVNPVTNKIYVSNLGSASVSVIDGATNGTTTVSAGTQPLSVAVNPVTNKIYVTNISSNNVSVIDGATNGTTTVSAGTQPVSVAVNPVTNKIYVGNQLSNNVTVIDGATNGTTTVSAGTQPVSVAVNPVTNKIYVANISSNNVTVIDGATNGTTTVSAGTNPYCPAVNPVTNKIYVGNYNSANVTVIDGATNGTATVSVGSSPFVAAVNPVTNKIYVGTGGDVTVIDGATNATMAVSVGFGPVSVAVNPVTNKIYVANFNSDDVTVIDGATNGTTTVSAGSFPFSVAVNPVTNKIYVANYGSNNVTVIDGATNGTTTVSAGSFPFSVAVNPVTNKIYVANYGSNNVTVIDGATNGTTTVSAGSSPRSVAVNPVTNKIYVANQTSNNVTVIDGATNGTTTVSAGLFPWSVAVNSVTNKLYVSNGGGTNVTVIDGATNSTATVSAGTNPRSVVVNSVTNKIYVANYNSNNVTVIDGATNAATTVSAGVNPSSVTVNPVTNMVYVSNQNSNNLTVLTEQNASTIPLTTTITALAGNVTGSPTPTFTVSAASTFSPTAPPVQGVFTQVDTWQGTWNPATPSGSNYLATTPTLGFGTHILYAYAVDGQQGIGCSNGNGSTCSPLVGSIAAYVFTVVPLVATVPGAPTISAETPGNTTVTVSFTAPGSDGGSPITGYTAQCGGPTGPTASGTTPSILVTGLTNGVPVTCTVVATNAVGNSLPATSGSVTPTAGAVVNITTVPAPAAEGTGSGNTSFSFILTRTGPAVAFNVSYTVTGNVVTGEDYNPVSGTVAFTSAQTTRTVTVLVKKDTKHEINENLTLNLISADNGVSVGGTATGTTQVLNDDNAPTISIGNKTVTEGGVANFAVTLSNETYQQVQVTAMTADGTANGAVTAPFPQADYTPVATVVTFAANTTTLSQNVGVPTTDDTVHEGGSETFTVGLSAASNGSIGTSPGNGVINDNDGVPTVSVTSVGNQSESVATYVFTVTLNRPSVQSIDVTAATADGTASATAGVFPQADYVAVAPTVLTFAPGQTSKTVNVSVIDDAIDEASETFFMQLSSLVNVNPGTVSRTGTLNDNDATPTVTITAPAPVGEESGPAVFTISLSAISGVPVTSTASTVAVPGTATPGLDYTATSQMFTWAPGTNASQTLSVPLLPDALNESNETFRVNLSGGGAAVATILDNDPIPTASIDDVSIAEGDSGTSLATFTVTLSAPSGRIVQIKAVTANQTAGAPSDYTQVPAAILVFPQGTTTQTVSVTVNGDVSVEPNETFLVNLTALANATLSDSQGVGTILNDESPALSIDDVVLSEGDSGTTNMTFTVSTTLAAPTGGVGFTYVTSGVTATEGDDYVGQGPTTVTGTSGGILFGNTSTTITVPINGDVDLEGAETFTVTLSTPTALVPVTIFDGVGVGTIQNDDEVLLGSLLISEFRSHGPVGSKDEFIEIANPTESPVTVYSTDLSGGFSVADSTGTLVFKIPDGTTIPARGHFLGANTTPTVGYSLGSYGGGASPDTLSSWQSYDLGDDVGLALFDTADSAKYATTGIVYDAVGFTSDPQQYKEGAGLVGIGGLGTEHSFVRRYAKGAGLGLQDTDVNEDDWVLVATDGANYGTGPVVAATLGGPSPENLSSENELSNFQLTISNAPGGPVFTAGPPKSLEFHRTFTNNTGVTLNSLRFKVTSITGVNNIIAGEADLRPTTSSTAAGYFGLTLETPPAYGVTLGGQPNAGLGSTLRLNSGLPLLSGLPVNVNFRVEYTISGGTFFYWVVAEAK